MFWPFTVWGFLKPNFEPHEYWISRTRCCNSTYRLRYWNFPLSTTITKNSQLQQYLPLAVLKPVVLLLLIASIISCNSTYRLRYWNIMLGNNTIINEVSCNSTYRLRYWNKIDRIEELLVSMQVATVLTACGIETRFFDLCEEEYKLQQYLPLAVLKR